MPQSTLLTVELVLASMTLAIAVFGALTVATSKLNQGRAAGLVIFLLIAATDSGDDILTILGVYSVLPELVGWAWPWPTLYGPALYLYVHAMTSIQPVVMTSRLWWWFALPALTAVVLATPFYLQPAEVKLALTAGQAGLLSNLPIALRWGLNGLYILFFSVSLFFLVIMFRRLSKHVDRVRDLFSNIEDRSLNWLRWVLLVTCVACLWAGVVWWFSTPEASPPWLDPLRLIFQLVWVSCFAAFGIAQGPAFTGALSPEEGIAEPDADQQSGSMTLIGGRYLRSGLTELRMRHIATKLKQAMADRQLHRDPQLSLRALSTEIGVSENYVSQTLNVQIGQKFFDFVNVHRIEDAKRQLTSSNDTTLTVAMKVGFNSRSTFNEAFKKHAGCTPSAFRDSIRTGKPGKAHTG